MFVVFVILFLLFSSSFFFFLFIHTVKIRGMSANFITWRPTAAAIAGFRRYFTVLEREEDNPVAPASALQLLVAQGRTFEDDDTAVPSNWVHLGRVQNEVASILGSCLR